MVVRSLLVDLFAFPVVPSEDDVVICFLADEDNMRPGLPIARVFPPQSFVATWDCLVAGNWLVHVCHAYTILYFFK